MFLPHTSKNLWTCHSNRKLLSSIHRDLINGSRSYQANSPPLYFNHNHPGYTTLLLCRIDCSPRCRRSNSYSYTNRDSDCHSITYHHTLTNRYPNQHNDHHSHRYAHSYRDRLAYTNRDGLPHCYGNTNPYRNNACVTYRCRYACSNAYRNTHTYRGGCRFSSVYNAHQLLVAWQF